MLKASSLPKRSILTSQDLKDFQSSTAYQSFTGFLEALNESVKDRSLLDPLEVSPAVQQVLDLLDTLEGWCQVIPPQNTSSRFGDPAFQTWFDRLDQQRLTLLSWLPSHQEEASIYLLHSFGNRKRIDYGTGHEAHFIAFLLCLQQIGWVSQVDYAGLVLRVFWKYIRVMRVLQCKYWLEPAGSHGVWGLDDYHFLPFYFGASQLASHRYLKPKSIHNQEVLEEFSKHYMYLSCVKFVNSVKTESLRWHSPMLDDISAVKSWHKVNSGLLKMYVAEVLGKLPIMQHFLFGSLISFQGSASDELGHEDHGHDHVHAFGEERPTCCGMRVPCSLAAAGVRHIPFD